MNAEPIEKQPAPTVGAPVYCRRARQVLLWTLGVASLVVLFGSAYSKHAASALEGTHLNDDVLQQVFPFYKYSDPTLFNGDYIADYYRLNLPIGFHASYWLGAKVWDPDPLSRALPYPLLVATVCGLAVAARQLAGGAAAWGVALFTLSSGVFLDRIVGGLPRAFGFPLFAWGLAALVGGKPKQLGVVTVIGIAFYPVVGVVLGGTLGLWLLVWPKATRGDAETWSLKRRAAFLSAVAGACMFFTALVMVIGRGYGSRVGPDDIAEFPEAGVGGRYDADSRPPFAPVLTATWKQWRNALAGVGDPVIDGLRPWKDAHEALSSPSTGGLFVLVSAFLLGGFTLLAVSSRAAQRLLVFVVVALSGYVAAVYTSPWLYLPERYTNYAVALVAVLVCATSSAGYVEFLRQALPARWLRITAVRDVAVIVTVAALFCVMGGRGDSGKGYVLRLNSSAPIFRSLASLPKNAVVAGWPAGLIDYVPHVARRSALFTYETHQAFHKGYMLEMRERANAFFDAYLATDTKPLVALREKFGVTHLLVDFNHLDSRKYWYFRPFSKRIQDSARRMGSPDRGVLHHLDQAIVFKHGKTAVFDLSRIN